MTILILSNNRLWNRCQNPLTKPSRTLPALQSILTQKLNLCRLITIFWIRTPCNRSKMRGLFLCMDRISNQLWFSTLSTKNIPTTWQNIRGSSPSSKIILQGIALNPSLTKADNLQAIIGKCIPSKLSSQLPPYFVRIRKTKETRNRRQECREVGCHRKIRPYPTLWERQQSNSRS